MLVIQKIKRTSTNTNTSISIVDEEYLDIKKYSDMDKLTFFVGAGVSKLSNFPSWYELVKSMGDDIDYPYNTKFDSEGNATIDLSQEEFLKIPEMYFLNKGEEQYYDFIKNKFANQCKPNEIHNLIMSLYPNHILTTNYDTLIEETAINLGKNYSVISSDKDVSKTENQKYILKVHGDFSSDFVLKESDYLNYEFNYQLVINLMKSIFATNLVVFIGYSLSDYNIKLIMNWVYNAQKDEYIKPIFINTDNKITSNEKKYYNKKGIRIIDCHSLGVFNDNTNYLERYKVVLNKIHNFEYVPDINNKYKVIDFLYNQIKDIKNLNYITRKQFESIFEKKYIVSDNWQIQTQKQLYYFNNNKDFNIWNDYIENKDSYLSIDKNKCKVLDKFLDTCLINIDKNKYLNKLDLKIDNIAFDFNYTEIEAFCGNEYDDLSDKYKKAYYLFHLGEFRKSYELYVNIIKEAQQNDMWDIFYLSQINRYHLYRIINHIHTNRSNDEYEKEFFKQLDLDMKNFKLEMQFSEMPYSFRVKYKFLNKYSTDSLYNSDNSLLMNEKYELEKKIKSDIIYIGISKFDKLKLTMYENIKFIYENMLLLHFYNEVKNHIMDSMLIWLQCFEKEKSKLYNTKEINILNAITNTRLEFTYQDIILLSNSCKINDWEHISEKINFYNIPFNNVKQLEEIILTKLNIYEEIEYTNNFYLSYTRNKTLILELLSLFYFSSYYIKDEDIIIRIITFIAENYYKKHFLMSNEKKIILKYVNYDLADKMLILLEEIFVERINSYINSDKTDTIIFDYIRNHSYLIYQIVDKYKDNIYKLEKLSNLLLKYEYNAISSIIPYMSDVLIYMNDTVKSLIIENTIINNLDDIAIYNNIINVSDYKDIIVSSINEKIKDYEIKKSIHTIYANEINPQLLVLFSIDHNIHNFIKEKCTDLKGKYAEIDFLLYIDDFDESKFNPEWLLLYNDRILKYIKEDEVKTDIVKKSLNKMDKTKCSNNIDNWFVLYERFCYG